MSESPATVIDRSPDLADLSDALATVDPAQLGTRIKELRKQKRLTQQQVLNGELSVAYLSRIEGGQRRPNLKVLRVIARGMGTSPHELLLGFSPMAWSERRVELDWAQLSLRTGDAEAALARTRTFVDELPVHTELGRTARMVHAQSLEATGDFERATMVLEELVEAAAGEPDLNLLATLSRCYRQAGELGRSIEVGRQAQVRLSAAGLDGSPEAIRLALTVAAAHAEVGDIGYASRLCRKALVAAEKLGTPAERAGCYWNASILESRRGNPEAAVELARRAMTVLDEADSARSTARLRTNLGLLYLRLDDPDLDAATSHLTTAAAELDVTDSSIADRTSNRLGLARATFLRGDLNNARVAAEAALDDVTGIAPLVAVEGLALLGQIAVASGDVAAAQRWYDEAILILNGEDDDRYAAQLWYELGGLCLEVGSQDAAVQAFQRAGNAIGLRSSARVSRSPQRAVSPA